MQIGNYLLSKINFHRLLIFNGFGRRHITTYVLSQVLILQVFACMCDCYAWK